MFLKSFVIFVTLYVSCAIAYPLSEHVQPSKAEDVEDTSHAKQLHLEQPISITDIPEGKEARAFNTDEYALPLIEKYVPFNADSDQVRKVRHIGFGGGFGGFGGVIGGVSASPIYSSVPLISTVPVTNTITTVPVVSSISTIQTIPNYGYGNFGGFGGGSYGYNYKSFGFGGGFLG